MPLFKTASFSQHNKIRYLRNRADATNNLTPATDRLHIGNHWLGQSGLNYYDNTARLHDPLLADFKSGDPRFADYPSLNHYSHCATNPVMYVDNDGRQPIYSPTGEFLGTDDRGLTGDFIIMD